MLPGERSLAGPAGADEDDEGEVGDGELHQSTPTTFPRVWTPAGRVVPARTRLSLCVSRVLQRINALTNAPTRLAPFIRHELRNLKKHWAGPVVINAGELSSVDLDERYIKRLFAEGVSYEIADDKRLIFGTDPNTPIPVVPPVVVTPEVFKPGPSFLSRTQLDTSIKICNAGGTENPHLRWPPTSASSGPTGIYRIPEPRRHAVRPLLRLHPRRFETVVAVTCRPGGE